MGIQEPKGGLKVKGVKEETPGAQAPFGPSDWGRGWERATGSQVMGRILRLKPLPHGVKNHPRHLTHSIPPCRSPSGEGCDLTLGPRNSLVGKEETNRHQKADGDQGHPDNVP